MIGTATILVAAVLVPAFFYSRVSKVGKKSYGNFLVFAGAYLFSITIVHILPELFAGSDHSAITTIKTWKDHELYKQDRLCNSLCERKSPEIKYTRS